MAIWTGVVLIALVLVPIVYSYTEFKKVRA